MAAQRMLVLLSRMENGDTAAQTVLRALHAAARPYGMRFLVSSAFREAFRPIKPKSTPCAPTPCFSAMLRAAPAMRCLT